jgi:ubiquinone/menaquinone biosynthesis C-methylase UbiE
MGKNIFDEIAYFYDNIFPEHIFMYYLEKRLNLIKKICPDKNTKILDVGCGTGALLYNLMESGYNNLWGIDNSAKMVEIANQKIPNRIIRGDMLNLPFSSESFDLVISIVSLHHLGDLNKVKKAIYEMIRVTKNSGNLIIWEHNPYNLYWYFLMKRVPQDTGEEKLVPLKTIINEFKKNKVKIVKVIRKGIVPDFAPKWSLPFLDFFEKGIQKIFPLSIFLAHNIVIGEKS